MTAPSNSRTLGLDPSTGGMSLPRLLFALLRQRFTGTLELEQPGSWDGGLGIRSVWFRGGMPVFTDWSSESDRLGDLLVGQGVIDAAMHDRALRALAGGGDRRLGEILLELGAIDGPTRTEALRNQCMRKLVSLFGLRGGDVTIVAREHDKGQADELAPINVLALILRGVLGHFDEARIRAEMGSALTGDLVATPALARYQRQFGFVADDDRILASLARGVGFEGLLKPGIDPRRVSQIVYTLWACQMLRFGQDANEAIAKGATAAAAVQDVPAVSKPAPPVSKPVAAASKPAAKPVEPPPPPKPAQTVVQSPQPEPEPPPPGDDFDFEGQLGILEAKVQADANAFELFALPADADRKQIRAAWAELSKRFHPDALEGAGRGAMRERVDHVFAALSEAYGVLSDKDAREKLQEAIVAGGSGVKATDDAGVVVRNAFEAELMARDADKLLRGSSWARARDIYARAHELSPSDPDIEAALIYSRHMASERDMNEVRAAIAGLARIVELAPACSRAFYFAGMIHLQLDERDQARLRFADALRTDVRNVDAERQLRALKIQDRAAAPSSSEPEKKGFGLRGLFGKK